MQKRFDLMATSVTSRQAIVFVRRNHTSRQNTSGIQGPLYRETR